MAAELFSLGANSLLNTRDCTWSGIRMKRTTRAMSITITKNEGISSAPSASSAAFPKSCSTWNPFDFATSAYESFLLAMRILSLGIPLSLRFWACAEPWFPNLKGFSRIETDKDAGHPLTRGTQSSCYSRQTSRHLRRNNYEEIIRFRLPVEGERLHLRRHGSSSEMGSRRTSIECLSKFSGAVPYLWGLDK